MGRSPKPARPAKPRVSPEDEALFLGAIDGAVPLAGRDRVPVVPPKVLVTPPATLPPRQAITLEGTTDEVSGRGPGVNRAQLGELRRGAVRAEATLDLHGLTTASAIPALDAFLLESVRLRRTHVAQALDVAAPALAIGADVPAAALERMLQAPVPDAAYRLLGDLGWRYQAYRNGLAQRALRAQPLA